MRYAALLGNPTRDPAKRSTAAAERTIFYRGAPGRGIGPGWLRDRECVIGSLSTQAHAALCGSCGVAGCRCSPRSVLTTLLPAGSTREAVAQLGAWEVRLLAAQLTGRPSQKLASKRDELFDLVLRDAHHGDEALEEVGWTSEWRLWARAVVQKQLKALYTTLLSPQRPRRCWCSATRRRRSWSTWPRQATPPPF